QRADVNLYVYRGEKEEFHTMSSAVAVIDALVLALSDSMQPKAAEKLMRLQKLKKKYGSRLYGKEDGKSGQEESCPFSFCARICYTLYLAVVLYVAVDPV